MATKWTDEQKARQAERMKTWHASRTPEQKQKFRDRQWARFRKSRPLPGRYTTILEKEDWDYSTE